MKRILLTLTLLASVCYAEVPMSFDQDAIWLDGTVWTNDPAAKLDTLTVTGTMQYSNAFQLNNGYLTFYAKCKYSSAAADTDTVRIMLYSSGYRDGATTAGPTNRWIAEDSVTWGGRADTLYKRAVFSLAGKYGIWWRLGFKKLMGVPKLLDKSRNSQ